MTKLEINLQLLKHGYFLQLYKTKIDNDTLNESLLKIVNVLEQNGDSYTDNLPISVNPFQFTISEESQIKWKEQNNISPEKTVEECFNILKEKYKIMDEDVNNARKIMTLRYLISKDGYSNKMLNLLKI